MQYLEMGSSEFRRLREDPLQSKCKYFHFCYSILVSNSKKNCSQVSRLIYPGRFTPLIPFLPRVSAADYSVTISYSRLFEKAINISKKVVVVGNVEITIYCGHRINRKSHLQVQQIRSWKYFRSLLVCYWPEKPISSVHHAILVSLLHF